MDIRRAARSPEADGKYDQSNTRIDDGSWYVAIMNIDAEDDQLFNGEEYSGDDIEDPPLTGNLKITGYQKIGISISARLRALGK